MRILLLSQFYAPVVGGIERVAEDIARALARRGHDVVVATLAGAEGVEDADGWASIGCEAPRSACRASTASSTGHTHSRRRIRRWCSRSAGSSRASDRTSLTDTTGSCTRTCRFAGATRRRCCSAFTTTVSSVPRGGSSGVGLRVPGPAHSNASTAPLTSTGCSAAQSGSRLVQGPAHGAAAGRAAWHRRDCGGEGAHRRRVAPAKRQHHRVRETSGRLRDDPAERRLRIRRWRVELAGGAAPRSKEKHASSTPSAPASVATTMRICSRHARCRQSFERARSRLT